MSLKLGLTHLSISHCHGVDNDTVSSLLARMPALKELHLADDANGTGEIFDGEGWPLDKLTSLREFSLFSPATDTLIRRLLTELPNLTSLKLWRCDGMRGIDWPRDVKSRSFPSSGARTFPQTHFRPYLSTRPI